MLPHDFVVVDGHGEECNPGVAQGLDDAFDEESEHRVHAMK